MESLMYVGLFLLFNRFFPAAEKNLLKRRNKPTYINDVCGFISSLQ
jgi:hypothetical protein